MNLDEIAIIHHVIRDIEEAEEEENVAQVPRARFFDPVDAFNRFSDDKFLKNFRLTKNTTKELITILRPFMDQGRRVTDLSIETKVLVALNFTHNPLPGTPEHRFQNTFKSTRSLIERCNGKLKNRFRSLLKHRVLHYDPEFAGHIVNACVVLHNICTDRNNPEPVDNDANAEDIDYGMYVADVGEGNRNVPFANGNADLAAGRHLRAQIIQRHFN